MWGSPISDLQHLAEGSLAGTPCPAVFSTPGGFKLVPVCDQDAMNTSLIDDWTGPVPDSLGALLKSAGHFVPAQLSQLATVKLFQERELTPTETKLLTAFRMRHTSGEQRLFNRYFWCCWYGYSNTPAHVVLAEHHACAGRIIPTTGLYPPAGVPMSATNPCGRDRYCLGCERHLAIMSRGYQTDVVL